MAINRTQAMRKQFGETRFPVMALVACIAATALCTGSVASAAPVRTDAGQIEGIDEGGIRVFKGIPFAAPPVGALRWRAPEPISPWAGVRLATEFAPACPQNQSGNAAMGFPILPTSEDCLYLNVWSPTPSSSDRLPVMVWIYGGAFMGGATSLPVFSGEALARKGVVVVSVAYRVGALGFMAHKELSAESPARASGTYGLMDLIAGLEWVRRNIGAFGGDPARITIFGESAGGTAVSMLAASPKAAGLFHRAISQSGGAFAPPRTNQEGGQTTPTLAAAEKRGADLLTKLGAESIADARKASVDEILGTTPAIAEPPAPMPPPPVFWPVLDGDVLPDDLYKLYEAEKYNDIPVLAGINSDEGAMFVPSITTQQYQANVRSNYGAFAERIIEAYPATSDVQALRSARDLFSDTIFGWPTWTWARLQSSAGGNKVFLYYFSRRTAAANARPGLVDVGALHGAEIAYVFRHSSPSWLPDDQALSDLISDYWVNFARTGDPNGPGLPAWPSYESDASRLMQLDVKSSVIPIPNLDRMSVLDEYYAWRRRALER